MFQCDMLTSFLLGTNKQTKADTEALSLSPSYWDSLLSDASWDCVRALASSHSSRKKHTLSTSAIWPRLLHSSKYPQNIFDCCVSNSSWLQ